MEAFNFYLKHVMTIIMCFPNHQCSNPILLSIPFSEVAEGLN